MWYNDGMTENSDNTGLLTLVILIILIALKRMEDK